MRPPPSCLPSATSRKWHTRRLWDGLGYLRVRSLANPNWPRDIDRLIKFLRREDDDPLLDAAIRAARAYRDAKPGEREQAWDAVLEPIDRFLEVRQAEHLRAVADAGCSGPQASNPPAGS